MTVPTERESVAERLAEVRRAVRDACREAGRPAADAHIVAVSKFHPTETVEAALGAGHRQFGENRVQEAATKWPELRERYPDVRLHLLGQLQTNKARQAVKVFDVISVLDRDRLARVLADAIPDARPGLQLLVQVNVGREPQKGGVDPEEADAFVDRCRRVYQLPVTGVMGVPPYGQNPEPYFRSLRAFADRCGLDEVSMGMTEDFSTAVRCGATQIRIGRAIFGDRPARIPVVREGQPT